MRRSVLLNLAILGLATASADADFQFGNLVVLRLGDATNDFSGDNTADTNAKPLYLDEYNLTTNTVTSHVVAANGAAALTLGGRGEHDGHLTLSSNGQYLTFGGYRANSGAANPVLSNAADVNRVIGVVNSNWNVDTSTALTNAYDKTFITAVVSDNGERFWTTGDGKDYGSGPAGTKFPTTTGGLRYVSAVGSTTSVNVSHDQSSPAPIDANNDTIPDLKPDGTVNYPTSSWPDSIRSAKIYNGQLYIMTPAPESHTYRGAFKTNVALPTASTDTVIGQTGVIINAPPSTDTSGKFVPKSDIVFLDLTGNDGVADTAYSTGGKDDYEKWSLVGGSWVQQSVKLLPSGEEINALDAIVTGGVVNLFASTDQGIYKLTDTTTFNTDFAGLFTTKLFTAAPNQEFRGLALLVPEPASLGLIAMAGLGLLGRRRK